MKVAESTLARHSEVLAQLEGVYSKIQQAADQVEIVRVMEASTGVLKSLNCKVGGVEKVQDVVEELREEMGKVEEIGDIMNGVSQGEATIGDGDVDEELEAMEREQRSERERLEGSETVRRLAELTGAYEIKHSGTLNTAQGTSGQTGVEERTGGFGQMSLDERSPWQVESDQGHRVARQNEVGSLENDMA